MARQVLPVVVLPSDVDALKSHLAEKLTSTDIGVQACSALPDATRAEWGIFYATAMGWTQSSTSILAGASQANLGEGYENELFGWQKRLQSAGCAVPVSDPQPPEAPGTSLVKWATVAVAAVAGAYVVGRVTEVAVEALKLAPRKS